MPKDRSRTWVEGGAAVPLALALALALACVLGAGDAPKPSPGPPTPPLLAPTPELAQGIPGLGRVVAEPARSLGRLVVPGPPQRDGGDGAPGLPPRNGRPRPGSIFDPGASGPGISQSGEENFLDGALDPRTGWPFVLLDHFRPVPEKLARVWVVQTRDCPQVMGTDPWPRLLVFHFDEAGSLVERDPKELLDQLVGRVAFVQVQGSLTTPDVALGGLLWSHSWLRKNRALGDDAVVIAFDWPSDRVYRSDIRDVNEKGRRASVAAYHLARFLQAFPTGSHVCLLGQSYGGRVVPSALHLLGGGGLDSQDHDPPARLPGLRPDLHVNAIVLAGASDHHWLNPGERLDHALLGCERFLNLYNSRDEALRLYPLLFRGGHRQALGKVGLRPRDLVRLGPLAARYEEHDIDPELGIEHTLLDAVANPHIAQLMAPYFWNVNPEPPPPVTVTDPRRRSFFSRGASDSGRPR